MSDNKGGENVIKKTIIGIYADRDNVETTINTLRDQGLNPKDMSIVMRNREDAKHVEESTGADVAGGAAGGITTGAILGGLAGLVAAFVIPGLGAFFIGGPIASALGLTGAAASTVSGAATGAVAGGLIGALMGLGLSHDEAEHYESRIKEGAILVAVPTSDTNEALVMQILHDTNAEDIKTVSQEENETVHQRSTGRTYADRDTSEDQTTGKEVRSQSQAFASAGAKGGKTHAANPIQVQKYLKGVDYPCSRDDLMAAAEREGATPDVLGTLRELPDQQYESPKQISEAIGNRT